jgi:NTP pyrophosphatase (non-canonical NTP hydrolase)
MTANEYQQLALRTEATPPFITDDLRLSRVMHGAMGMVTESAELMDMLKKHILYGKTFDLVNVKEEAADCLWYIALALDACGFTLEEAMESNIQKLRVRYPVKFTEEQALVRDLDAERKSLENI